MKAKVLFTLKRGGRYHIPNTASEIIEINELEYDRLKDVVELVDPEIAPGEPSGWLPEDFPFQQLLAEAAVYTYSDVREVKDLTEIKGIGPASAKKILAALEAAD